jgi:hypothetical protein
MNNPAFADFASRLAARIARRTRRLAPDVFDGYRPELHYMRGPGPKWREKHGLPPAPVESAREAPLPWLGKVRT